MKQLFQMLWPVVLLAIGALFCARMIEDPPYPVSPVHVSLVFLLGVVSWYCISISGIRRSNGLYAAGLGFGVLALANGLFPDLWLRWPEATLLGLAVSQVLAFLQTRKTIQSPRVFASSAGIIITISLLPLLSTVYLQWSPSTRPGVAAASALLLLVSAWMIWQSRQRRQSATGPLSVLFFCLVAGTLTLAAFTNLLADIRARQQAEEYMLFSLLLLASGFIADQIFGEQQLRSGPHMNLDASLVDPLTSLANRRALELYGSQLVKQSLEAGRAVTVIMADVDHFKAINDLHGHQAGDTVLRQTALKLKEKVRKSDLVARYGGEEFVIVLAGSPLAPALRLAERMRFAVENETVSHGPLEIKRTISFGVATAFSEEPASLSELIQRADTNLYRAKHAGRNRVMADALPTEDF